MHHIYTCPLNTTVERFLTASEKDSLSGDITIPPVAGNAMQQQDVPLEENWDEEATGVASLEDKIPAPAVAPIFINVQAMTPAERRHYYASLHSIADKKVPAHMRPYPQPAPRPGASNPLQRNETAMPPVPKTDPKVLQGLQLAQMTAKAQYAAAMDSDSDDDDDDDDDSDELDEADQSQAYRMGVGRGHVTSPKAAGADTDTEDKEIRSRVQLLGLGRGRPVQRNRPT
uniref:Uncharacterized protein n=1 Tax=Amblyomma maculatum TaxID=34609 RepID=G3MKD5_AMBMU